MHAHEQATNAEQAYEAGDYARAVEYHQKAAQLFVTSKQQTVDTATLEALQLLADSQVFRADSVGRRVTAGQGAGDSTKGQTAEDTATLPPSRVQHTAMVQTQLPSDVGGQGSTSTSNAGREGEGSRIDQTKDSMAAYQPPDMRTWLNAPGHWSDQPFMPAPVHQVCAFLHWTRCHMHNRAPTSN